MLAEKQVQSEFQINVANCTTSGVYFVLQFAKFSFLGFNSAFAIGGKVESTSVYIADYNTLLSAPI